MAIEMINQTLDSMNMIAESYFKKMNFDKTEICKIVQQDKEDTTKYLVSNEGGLTFNAYSDGNTVYYQGQKVYVTVIQGDYNLRKRIVGAYSDDKNESALKTAQPFDNFVIRNTIEFGEYDYLGGNCLNFPVVAETNSQNKFFDKNNFDYLGIEFNANSYNNADFSKFNLIIQIGQYDEYSPEIKDEKILSSDYIVGNPHNLSDFLTVQALIPLDDNFNSFLSRNSDITDIWVSLEVFDGNGTKIDENYDNYITFSNLKLHFGYDIKSTDKIPNGIELNLLKAENDQGAPSVDDMGYKTAENKKRISVEWYDEKNKIIYNANSVSDDHHSLPNYSNLDPVPQLYFFQYVIGYQKKYPTSIPPGIDIKDSGVYWATVAKGDFTTTSGNDTISPIQLFVPNSNNDIYDTTIYDLEKCLNRSETKFKTAIVYSKDGKDYYIESNELIFKNENENYLQTVIQDGQLFFTSDDSKFVHNKYGINNKLENINDHYKVYSIQVDYGDSWERDKYIEVLWKMPKNATMLLRDYIKDSVSNKYDFNSAWIDGDNPPEGQSSYPGYWVYKTIQNSGVENDNAQIMCYSIDSQFSYNKINNTILCEVIVKNNDSFDTYKGQVQLFFGSRGVAGTNYSFNIYPNRVNGVSEEPDEEGIILNDNDQYQLQKKCIKIISVTNADGTITRNNGVDYQLENNKRTITKISGGNLETGDKIKYVNETNHRIEFTARLEDTNGEEIELKPGDVKYYIENSQITTEESGINRVIRKNGSNINGNYNRYYYLNNQPDDSENPGDYEMFKGEPYISVLDLIKDTDYNKDGIVDGEDIYLEVKKIYKNYCQVIRDGADLSQPIKLNYDPYNKHIIKIVNNDEQQERQLDVDYTYNESNNTIISINDGLKHLDEIYYDAIFPLKVKGSGISNVLIKCVIKKSKEQYSLAKYYIPDAISLGKNNKIITGDDFIFTTLGDGINPVFQQDDNNKRSKSIIINETINGLGDYNFYYELKYSCTDPSTLIIKNADGTITRIEGVDYSFNEDTNKIYRIENGALQNSDIITYETVATIAIINKQIDYLKLPTKLVTISSNSFSNCELKSLFIPAGELENIGSNIFQTKTLEGATEQLIEPTQSICFMGEESLSKWIDHITIDNSNTFHTPSGITIFKVIVPYQNYEWTIKKEITNTIDLELLQSQYDTIVYVTGKYKHTMPDGTKLSFEAKYPIPQSSNLNYYIEGATSIAYDFQGTSPTWDKTPYKLFDNQGQQVSYIDNSNKLILWRIWYSDYDKKGNHINKNYPSLEPKTINNTEYFVLKPTATYNINGVNCAIQAYYIDKNGEHVLYTQPILITQNNYAFPLLNEWDGSTYVDKKEGIIMSQLIGAGEKNSQNQYSGVLMGNMRKSNGPEDKFGLYGFQNGALRFKLDEEGSFFVGDAKGDFISFNENARKEDLGRSGERELLIKAKQFNLETDNLKISSNNQLIEILNNNKQDIIEIGNYDKNNNYQGINIYDGALKIYKNPKPNMHLYKNGDSVIPGDYYAELNLEAHKQYTKKESNYIYIGPTADSQKPPADWNNIPFPEGKYYVYRGSGGGYQDAQEYAREQGLERPIWDIRSETTYYQLNVYDWEVNEAAACIKYVWGNSTPPTSFNPAFKNPNIIYYVSSNQLNEYWEYKYNEKYNQSFPWIVKSGGNGYYYYNNNQWTCIKNSSDHNKPSTVTAEFVTTFPDNPNTSTTYLVQAYDNYTYYLGKSGGEKKEIISLYGLVDSLEVQKNIPIFSFDGEYGGFASKQAESQEDEWYEKLSGNLDIKILGKIYKHKEHVFEGGKIEDNGKSGVLELATYSYLDAFEGSIYGNEDDRTNFESHEANLNTKIKIGTNDQAEPVKTVKGWITSEQRFQNIDKRIAVLKLIQMHHGQEDNVVVREEGYDNYIRSYSATEKDALIIQQLATNFQPACQILMRNNGNMSIFYNGGLYINSHHIKFDGGIVKYD